MSRFAAVLGAIVAATPVGAAPARPDLTVARTAEPPRYALPGERLTGADTVVNLGRRRAPATVTSYRLRGGLVGARRVPALRRGERSHGTARLRLPRGLPDGAYVLVACADGLRQVRESDERNNCRSAGTLTVDTTPPPPPAIDARPGQTSASSAARFAFSSSEPGVRFECRVDAGEFGPCTSPHDVEGLAEGAHRFEVRARDAAGNASGATAVEWTVVRAEVSLGDGAWSWFADPRALHAAGRTFVGWVARDGDVKVSAYEHASRVRTTALVAPDVQEDDHANPALQLLPDGRLRVYYSAHGGATMSYRTTLRAYDVTAWDAPRTLPANTPGRWGFTYPNPVRLEAERATYLFWRGGNFNPTYAVQADGADGWSAPRTLITAPGRPYVKVDSDGGDTIHFAFTNAHPNEAADVNIHYAAYRDGRLWHADGTPIGPLETAITPQQADRVYDTGRKSWVHDVAIDGQGRPVIVFASFAATNDHRYMYARWTGSEWVTHELTAAGGSISDDGREPFYSGGLTLDHEDPATVYLSRPVDGNYEIETWTTADGGATWATRPVTAPSDVKNVRPISPRGLLPFNADFSVAWMRGVYASYVDYRTSITTLLLTGGNAPPVADAEVEPRGGPAPQPVAFDARTSSDSDGTITGYAWDFGDGALGTGAQTTHRYEQPGHYFPVLTVTDDRGETDAFVTEVVVGPSRAPGVYTGPATATDGAATLKGTIDTYNQRTTYRFEYGPTTAYGARTPEHETSDPGDVQATVTGLTPGATYHYRLVASNATGTVAGADRTFVAAAPGASAYRAAVMATPGLVAYWRLGEHAGTTAADETGAFPGTYIGARLGEPGALRGDPDTAAGFDGGELTAATADLGAAGTLEGWFDWRAGVAVMRDDTSTAGMGWILAFDSGGRLAYRLGGTNFVTSRTVASLRDGFHHFAAAKDGGAVAFYLDGELLHSASGAGPGAPAMPWHVMRNGSSATEYARGRADEVAVYGRALSAAEVRQHYLEAVQGGG